jgi:hypothetical protein
MNAIEKRPIRIRTLVKLCGQPKSELSMRGQFPANRVVTVHHHETGSRLWAEVGGHPVNVFTYLVFPKQLARVNETLVLGLNHFALA